MIDLKRVVGETHNQLTILKSKKIERTGVVVYAKCSCGGKKKWYRYSDLKRGHTKSCGHCLESQGWLFGKLLINWLAKPW